MRRAGVGAPAMTVVWAGASLAGLSLVAAAAALMLDARDLPRPLLQIPAAALTGLLGIVVVYAAFLAVGGQVRPARWLLAASVGMIALLPTVRYVPFVYHVTYEQDLESLFPPLWPYSVALPLLLVVLGEMTFSTRRQGEGNGAGVVLAVVAAVLLMFFGCVLVGAMGSMSVPVMFIGSAPLAVLLPLRTLWASAVLVGITAFLVIAALLPRWGRVWEGVALLVLGGLIIELASTTFFAGTPGRLEMGLYGWPFFPFVPVLAGTVPGILSVFAGIVVGWSKAMEDAGDAQPLAAQGDVPASPGRAFALPEGQPMGGGTGGGP